MRVCHKQTHSHLFYLAHTNNDGQQKICFGPYIIFKDRARARDVVKIDHSTTSIV